MNQKGKIRWLIIVGVFSFLCLSLIQYYLVSSTYQFKRDQFQKEIKNKAHEALENIPAIDSIMDSLHYKQLKWMNRYVDTRNEILAPYLHLGSELPDDALSNLSKLKSNFVDSLEQSDPKLNEHYCALFNKQLKKMNVSHDVDIAVIQRQFIIEDTLNQLDTILDVPSSLKYKYVGQDIDLNDALVVTTGRTTGSFTFTDDPSKIPGEINGFATMYHCTYINIDQWKRTVLRQMTLTFILAILSILAVLGLFIWTLRAFIQQKKMADLKTDFINNITHELKTPLATLSIATKTINNENIYSDKEKLSNISQTINRQTKRLQRLVDQVLQNSIAAKDIKLNKKMITGDHFLKELVQDFTIGIENSNFQFFSDLQSNDCTLLLDTFYGTTAINNLLENAIKYNPNGILLNIKSLQTDKYFIIQIDDNGIGIDEKYHKYLFEKFYRVHTGNRHDVKGLGFGLYLSKQIITAHQGTIELQSKLGQGCLFTIKLPIHDA